MKHNRGCEELAALQIMPVCTCKDSQRKVREALETFIYTFGDKCKRGDNRQMLQYAKQALRETEE